MSADYTGTGTGAATPRPGRGRTALVLAAATASAVGLLLVLQLAVVRPALEADLGARATAAVRDAGYGGVSVSVTGRDLTASGTVTQGQGAADIEAALAAVPGARRVAVADVQLLTAPLPAQDGVVTSSADVAAVGLESSEGGVPSEAGGVTTGPRDGASATDADEADEQVVEGSRLLTPAFENATQSPGLPALAFVEGSPALTSDSDPALRAVADQILADTTGRVFVVRTHTDSVGASAYNQWLSERRASVVCDGLLALGVPEERLTITGVGESEPLVTPELTEADRATNRRVEIIPTV